MGEQVLLIDLDPQGNASTGLAISRSERSPGSYEFLLGFAPLADCVRPSQIPGLHVMPASIALSGAEIELIDLERREHRLADALGPRDSEARAPWTTILVDCPPSLGLVTLNALVAVDAVLVPVQAEFLALEGIGALASTVDRIKKRLNPRLHIAGVILTMVDRRMTLSQQVVADVRGHFGDLVFGTTIPRNVRIAEAPSHGLPVLIYDNGCAGAQAYILLARAAACPPFWATKKLPPRLCRERLILPAGTQRPWPRPAARPSLCRSAISGPARCSRARRSRTSRRWSTR